ncbi:hypothetical protein KQI63_06630 [bacterium]|nr:hypothetical protein [bacterium]
MMNRILRGTLTVVLLGIGIAAMAAGPYGSLRYTKLGVMNGNQVSTQFYNHGQIADWPNQPAGVWPKGTNHSYIDGVALIVAAEVEDINGNTIHPLSTMYREFMDTDPVTGDRIGWAPLPGWANPNQEKPAMSNDSNSWPWTWPDQPSSWDGYWNGYFGKGVTNADLETVFALDDASDNEYQFYPDPSDSLRRGLGLRVEARGFQWNHVLAEDCIFWHYEIENIGQTAYDETVFGMYIDWGVGGTDDSGDDAGSYDTGLDLAYAWDGNGVGTPGGWGPVGFAGFAFLESPGKGDDNLDNDEDGLVDERRDSGPGTYVFGPVGDYGPAMNHWSGDEDGDWDSYTDLNENDTWDIGEPLNDDVGEDGIGPNDGGYTGPDLGEADGVPTAGEPDFDQTDKDESDQIGLTAFVIFPVHFYELINEEQNWSVMSQIIPPTDEQLLGVNLGMYFFSGPFPLSYTGNAEGASSAERFSIALLFGNNKDDLFRNKTTVQAIYNANYNFAQPPDKPVLTAIPGDRKVTLYWDDLAEDSYDRFLQEYDFEGYRIYRSTDPTFIDARLVTDAYGNPTYRKPLAQYDLRDGRYGPHLVGVYGAHFDMGEDTGLRHLYVDTDVNNGVTYYYAVVSYDYGFIDGQTMIDSLIAEDGSDSVVVRFIPNLGPDGQVLGIAPTECTSTIIGDVGQNVQLDVNTAAVTPNAPAAGYVSPDLEDGVEQVTGISNSRIAVNLLVSDSLREGGTYEVRFSEAPTYGEFLHYPDQYFVLNGAGDTLYASDTTVFGEWLPYQDGEDPIFWASDPVGRRHRYFMRNPSDSIQVFWHPKPITVESPIIDGMSIELTNQYIDYQPGPYQDIDSLYSSIVHHDINYSGTIGTHPNLINLTVVAPYQYEIRWFDDVADTSTSALGSFPETEVNFEVWNLSLGEKSDFLYKEETAIEDGDTVVTRAYIAPKLPVGSLTRVANTFIMEAPPNIIDTTFAGADTLFDTTFVEKIMPREGDMVGWVPSMPFSARDSYRFVVHKGYLDSGRQKEDLKRVAVVPNPYVVTASWEPKVNFTKGRGPHKIDFIHLPKKCTIRIYTISGFLVDTLEHDSPVTDGSESWDLVSKDGMDIAYGVYVFHVDAPGVGEKVGRFAIIK